MLSGHTLDTIYELDYAFPLVVIATAVVVLTLFSKIFVETMEQWGFVISKR